MQLIAVHEIQRRDREGKLELIAPGKTFSADTKEAENLVARGAARKGKASEVETAKVAMTQGPEGGSDDDSNVELEKMTKAELIQFAKDNEIEIDEKATKGEILETIAADKAADDDLV